MFQRVHILSSIITPMQNSSKKMSPFANSCNKERNMKLIKRNVETVSHYPKASNDSMREKDWRSCKCGAQAT